MNVRTSSILASIAVSLVFCGNGAPANGEVGAGDEAVVKLIIAELQARKDAVKYYQFAAVEQTRVQGRVLSTRTWQVSGQSGHRAAKMFEEATDATGNEVIETRHTLVTPDFFATARRDRGGGMRVGEWHELEEGVGSSRIATLYKMRGGPDPLKFAFSFTGSRSGDVIGRMRQEPNLWQVDEEIQTGRILLSRTHEGKFIERYVVDPARGFAIVEHTHYDTVGAQALTTKVEVAKFDGAWFPTSIIRTMADGAEVTIALSEVKLNDPLEEGIFGLPFLKLADGASVTMHYRSGERKIKMWVKGELLDHAAAVALLQASRLQKE